MSVYTLSGCINLGNGQPNEALLPLDRLQRVMPTALEGAVHQHLNYGPERGFSPFIEALAQFLTEHYGHVVREDELSITNGNSAALALCCRTLAGRGDKGACHASSGPCGGPGSASRRPCGTGRDP